MAKSGTEIVATGRTAEVLKQGGLSIIPIEKVSGSPEAFQGRMKTLSFPVCSGILYRRGDALDEKDLKTLSIQAIDCVVVNFYPFEKAAEKKDISQKELIDEIDIGGPTLVRAAAKNSPEVLVLTDPAQYPEVISQLNQSGSVAHEIVNTCAQEAWEKILAYDQAIANRLGKKKSLSLRYGENPHQSATLVFDENSPIAWPKSQDEALTGAELSYNNIWDLSSAYALASDLHLMGKDHQGVVIVKHNNPCGVSLVPPTVGASAQLLALKQAWEGDPVSAFGGVLAFTHPIQDETAQWLSERFVELVAAPGLARESTALKILVARRKNLKAVAIRRLGEMPKTSTLSIPGGQLIQTTDVGLDEQFKSVTEKQWTADKTPLARFGIAVTRALKSNAIALVRTTAQGSFQLVGAGQGQPNRIEALEKLAIPRAKECLKTTGGSLADCVMISDAFFPFRDTVDTAAQAGIRWIVQPGGSIKDAESVQACNEAGVAMVFTGTRHFKH